MNPRIPRELVTDPLQSTEHSLGTAALQVNDGCLVLDPYKTHKYCSNGLRFLYQFEVLL